MAEKQDRTGVLEQGDIFFFYPPRLEGGRPGPAWRSLALQRFHARQADGRHVSGGAAFVALWSVLPSFSWLGRLFRAGPLLWGIERAYDSFLEWRPKLQGLAKRFLKTR